MPPISDLLKTKEMREAWDKLVKEARLELQKKKKK